MRKAVIDIGTNSVRLLVADNELGKWKPVMSDLQSTRIGSGVSKNKVLNREAMERTCLAIEEFVLAAKNLNVDNIIAVATSAVRDSLNKDEFVELVKARTGVKVWILSGSEEAWFSYQGVIKAFEDIDIASVLVIDIGGGSTEFIWYESDLKLISLPMGAVRMYEAKCKKEAIIEKIQEIKAGIGSKQRIIGVGGTITTLAAMDLGLENYNRDKVHGYNLNRDTVFSWYNKICSLDIGERRLIKGLQPKRADIIEYGLLILLVIMEELKIDLLTVSESDILYGLLFEGEG